MNVYCPNCEATVVSFTTRGDDRNGRGFALQRVYTADRSLDESIAVRDGDLVLVPRGYHTVSAAPGYELYNLNVMAGPVRRWCVSFDPDHERLRSG